MKVSVIITTKNEEKNIENCLRSIKNQKYPGEIEIIVVDNNSLDRTKEIAREYTNLIFNYGPERSVQRNFGVSKSSADYFIFLDADMILGENVIDQCVKMVRNDPEVAGLYIPEIVKGKNFFSKIRNFERSFYNATVIDGLRFIKKSIFDKVGGFDEEMYACEDWDLTKRISEEGRVNLIVEAIYHNDSAGLAGYLAKKSYYSKNIKNYILKWGKANRDVKKQLGFYYRFAGVFIENGKWKKVLAHPFLFVGVLLLKFLVAVNYIFQLNRNAEKR